MDDNLEARIAEVERRLKNLENMVKHKTDADYVASIIIHKFTEAAVAALKEGPDRERMASLWYEVRNGGKFASVHEEWVAVLKEIQRGTSGG